MLDDSYLLDLPSGTVLGSTQTFSDDEMNMTRSVWSRSGDYGIVGDSNLFGADRIVVSAFSGNTVTAAQVLFDVEDPIWLVGSPFDDGVLVASGFGDALWWLSPTGNPASPYTASELTYTGASPALPGGAVVVERGVLTGHALVAENVGIRQVSITVGGASDLGEFPVGAGAIPDIVGVIGVQP